MKFLRSTCAALLLALSLPMLAAVSTDTSKTGAGSTATGAAALSATAAANSANAAGASLAAAASSAKLYATYAAGVAATADGDFFSVYSADLSARLVYKRVSSQGELQGVQPFANAGNAHAARALASSQTFDATKTLPAGARADFVAVDSLFGFVNLRNRAYSAVTTQDLNLFGRSRPSDLHTFDMLGGVGNPTPTATYGVAGADAALKAVRLVYAGSGTSVYGMQPNAGNAPLAIPAGRWTVAFDAISASGTAAFRTFSAPTGTYAAVSVGTTWTTITQTFVLSADTTAATWQWVREAATPSAFDIKIDNFRLMPGSSAGTATAANEHLYRVHGLPLVDGLTVRGASSSGSGARVLSPLAASQAFTGVTAVMAVRKEGNGAQVNFLVSDDESSATGFYIKDAGSAPGLTAGLNAASSDMVGLPLNEWVIVTSAAGPTGSTLYVNDVKVAESATAYTGFTTDYFSLFGLAARNDANFYGKAASGVIYDRKLTDAEVLRAVAVSKARIAAHGERFTDYGTLFVAEGDSLTEGTGATAGRGYAKLLGANFTPRLQGIEYATPGNTLTNLLARTTTVDAKIAEAIALGKRVVFSVLIGTNEIPATNAAADAYYVQLKSYWSARRATGAKVIVGTIPDRNTITAGQRSALAYLNGLIRGDTTQYDGLADYAGNVNLSVWNGTNFGDEAHPNDTGHALMETILRPVVTTHWLP